jgi:FdhE protein
MELVTSLTVYRGLHGLSDLELSYIRRVEEAQARVIERLKGVVAGYGGLRDAVAALLESSELLRAAREIAGALGEEPPEAVGWGEVARVLSGDLDFRGARSLLLAIQAVARSYAEAVIESRGEGSGVTSLCPICGAASETMYRRRGGYYMVCHFCGYTWRVSGEIPLCPRCGAQPPLDVGVVSDRSRRLGLASCWRCGYTWRIILDEHVKAPAIALPLIALGAEKLRPALEEARRRSGEG